MGPTVTLEFKGDESDLMKSVDKVGDGIEEMGDKIGKTTKDIRSHSKAFDTMADGTDKAESKFTGFKDVLDGGSSALATLQDSSLSTTDKLIAFGQAGADMAGGLTDFLIPAIGSMATLMRGGLGSAMTFIAAHPLMIALIALAAIFVLLWTRSETFRNIVTGVFNAVAGVLKNSFGAAIDWLVGAFNSVVSFFSQLPSRIGGFFTAIGDAIKGAFKVAFNFVADIWNKSIGRLQFDIPSWVPFIGGNHFGVPQIPKFHTGINTVPGGPGVEMIATLQAGEQVLSASEAARGRTLHVTGDFNSLLFQAIKNGLKTGQLRLT